MFYLRTANYTKLLKITESSCKRNDWRIEGSITLDFTPDNTLLYQKSLTIYLNLRNQSTRYIRRWEYLILKPIQTLETRSSYERILFLRVYLFTLNKNNLHVHNDRQLQTV
jgi:hypothetical protein